MEATVRVEIMAGGTFGNSLREQVARFPGVQLVAAGGDVIVAYQAAPWPERLGGGAGQPGGHDPGRLVLLLDPCAAALAAAVLLGIRVLCDPQGPAEELWEGIRRAAAGEGFTAGSLHDALREAVRLRQAGPSVPALAAELGLGCRTELVHRFGPLLESGPKRAATPAPREATPAGRGGRISKCDRRGQQSSEGEPSPGR